MHESRARVITDTATTERNSSIAQCKGVDARDANVDGVSLHVLAVLRNPLGAGAQEFVAPRRAIATNDFDLGVRVAD